MMRRACTTSLLLAALWVPAPDGRAARAEAEVGPSVFAVDEIRDLHYGDVLFRHYAGDDRGALIRLLAHERAGRLEPHATEASALAGSLLLGEGLLDRAEARFRTVLAQAPRPALRDRVGLELGRLHHRRGDAAAALAALDAIGGADEAEEGAARAPALTPRMLAESRILAAQNELALGRADAAAARLADLEAPQDWQPYARYNLAVALLRSDAQAAGLEALLELGAMPALDPGLLALRDRANLAAGYAWLQRGEPEPARVALARVRLDGPETEAALLGLGWARAESGDLPGALAPWMRLAEVDGWGSAVQEARIAVPWALAEQGAEAAAARGYEEAIAGLDEALAELDVARRTVVEHDWLEGLLADESMEEGRLVTAAAQLPFADGAGRLRGLVASQAFQTDLQAWRELSQLASELDAAAQRLEAYEDLVALQVRVDAERAPRILARREVMDPVALRARRDALAARLEAARSSRDAVALATPEEASQWAALEAVGAMRALQAAPQEARDRYRLLRGHLYWQLDREFDYRLWQQTRVLEELDEALAELEPGLLRLDAARGARPQDLDETAARLDGYAARVADLRRRAALARTQGAALLAARIDAWFEDERDRLLAYRVQASFALATLYDRAASSAVAAVAEVP
ncbi:MAG: hypothetical protein V2J24_23505 [Pseudomonadales bacterium]|jgi:hypothetical protein|nr:hypothetical protein [Pseudomonadales bacterium]